MSHEPVLEVEGRVTGRMKTENAMHNKLTRRAAASATCCLGATLGLLVAAPASAASLEFSLGNTSSGLVPGTVITVLDLIAAQAGQPAPFDQGYGSDSFEDFAATWTFSFAPIADPISAASIEIGLYDADAASPGSQVNLFSVDGTDLTGVADAAFEATGGASGVYDVYTVDLASVLASLADGSVGVSLRLMGPVESPVLFPPPDFVVEDFNGAAMIFSTLRITTRTPPVEMPEPGSLWLLGSGLLGLAAARRRRAGLI